MIHIHSILKHYDQNDLEELCRQFLSVDLSDFNVVQWSPELSAHVLTDGWIIHVDTRESEKNDDIVYAYHFQGNTFNLQEFVAYFLVPHVLLRKQYDSLELIDTSDRTRCSATRRIYGSLEGCPCHLATGHVGYHEGVHNEKTLSWF